MEVIGKCLVHRLSFQQTDRRTDRQTDRWTPVKQYAPNLSMRGHKKIDTNNISIHVLTEMKTIRNGKIQFQL